MPYIGKSPSAGVRQRYQYTATAGQTTFSGTDLGNLTLTYTDNNFVDVFQNGVLLKGGGNDYTATSGTSVVLGTGATADDVIEIIVYDVFSVGNFFNRTDSDSRYVNVDGDTMTGSLDLNGTELVLDADADTSITSDTDDQIDIKVGGSDKVTINSSGIGIGNTSPDQLLNLGNTSSSQPILQFLAATDGASTIHFGDGSGADAYKGYINFSHSDDTLQLASGGSERMRVTSDGRISIGSTTAQKKLYVYANSTRSEYSDGWIARFHNDGNAVNLYGIEIFCGTDDASGTNYPMRFVDGDGGEQGFISFSSGTVSYGAFTANHPCIIPDADNTPTSTDNAYPYGTLLETTSIQYTQKNGANTERGIVYNVRKTQSANSKKVLGAYGGSMNQGPNNHTNMHQALVLGDGHILCNNAGGNISIGDGICSSSTAGIGQKATANPSMIVGIAQEDVTFSGSETKLVAVQYGLQQFIPWS